MQHHPQKKSISIIGAGWLGLACAQQLVTSGHSVKGSSRSAATLEALTAMGAQAFRIDLPQTVQNAQDFFRQCEVLIITLPPRGRQHGSATAQMYLAKLTALLPYLKGANAPSVIYTSSTGVYGSVLGEIDEVVGTDSQHQLLDRGSRRGASAARTCCQPDNLKTCRVGGSGTAPRAVLRRARPGHSPI
jgi:nucleoside-diphosphate-sugar epimerase